MTIRVSSQDGATILEKEPLFGYNCARKQGSLSAAVLYLSTLRSTDWCVWLARQLSEAYPSLSYETAAALVCLAYLRWPVKPEKLVDWTTYLLENQPAKVYPTYTLGETHRSRVEEAVAELMFREDEFGNAVQFPFSDDQIQLNSNWRWEHLPSAEIPGGNP